jgi:hypothetical protein
MVLQYHNQKLLVGVSHCSTDVDYQLNGLYQVLCELDFTTDQPSLRALQCHRVDGIDIAQFERHVNQTDELCAWKSASV